MPQPLFACYDPSSRFYRRFQSRDSFLQRGRCSCFSCWHDVPTTLQSSVNRKEASRRGKSVILMQCRNMPAMVELRYFLVALMSSLKMTISWCFTVPLRRQCSSSLRIASLHLKITGIVSQDSCYCLIVCRSWFRLRYQRALILVST